MDDFIYIYMLFIDIINIILLLILFSWVIFIGFIYICLSDDVRVSNHSIKKQKKSQDSYCIPQSQAYSHYCHNRHSMELHSEFIRRPTNQIHLPGFIRSMNLFISSISLLLTSYYYILIILLNFFLLQTYRFCVLNLISSQFSNHITLCQHFAFSTCMNIQKPQCYQLSTHKEIRSVGRHLSNNE